MALLSADAILTHPAVIGELACGTLRDRKGILESLAELPTASCASDAEVMALVERRGLYGRGIGWVDAQLLASALLSECALWTLDKALARVAADIGLACTARP